MRIINRSVLFTVSLALSACGGSDGDKSDSGAGGAGGNDSGGCTVADNKDGTATVTCADGTSAVVSGPAGEGCTAKDNGDGSWTLTCGDGTSVNVTEAAQYGGKLVALDQYGTLYLVEATDGDAASSYYKLNGPYLNGGAYVSYQVSPDKKHVAILQKDNDTGFQQLYVTSVSGTKPTKLTLVNDTLVDGGSIDSFVWSPNGSAIAYIGDQDVVDEVNLYVASVKDGKVSNRVTVSGAATASAPSAPQFSADATQILFLRSVDLYVSPVKASAQPDKVNGTLLGGSVTQPTFTADGKKIGYLALQGTDTLQRLYVASVSAGVASAAKPVGSQAFVNDGVKNYAFTADSKKAVYLADPTTAAVDHVYVSDLTGTSPSAPKVVDDFDEGGDVTSFKLTSDSKRVVLLGSDDTAGTAIFQLYSSDISGATPGAAKVINQDLVDAEDVSFYDISAQNTVFYLTDAGTEAYEQLYLVDAAGSKDPVRVNHDLGNNQYVSTFQLSTSGTHALYTVAPGVYSLATFLVEVGSGKPANDAPIKGTLGAYTPGLLGMSNAGDTVWAYDPYTGFYLSKGGDNYRSVGPANTYIAAATFLDVVK
jgi:hypothetical protein